MCRVPTISLPSLKGTDFESQLRRVCSGPLPSYPLPDRKYGRILLPHMIGGEIYFAMVGMIGQALRIRGAEVIALQCDAFLPACTLRKVDHHESACTRWCQQNAHPFAEAMQFPSRWYREFITEDEKRVCDRIADGLSSEELSELEHMGVELGWHIKLSVESFFKIGRFDPDDPAMLDKAREFARSAMYLTHVGHRALDELRIDKVVMEDGKKVDWGVIRSVALRKGIPVDCIRAGLRDYSIRFEYDRPPEMMLMMPEWETWKSLPLSPQQERVLDDYLRRREKVPFEYRSSQWQSHTTDKERVRRLIGLPEQVAGKTFALFPNVGFDAGTTKTVAAFENPNDWIAETIRFMANRPEHHVVVKAHPAEHHRQSQDPLIPYLQARFPRFPENVHLIPPDTDITAQTVARLSDWVIAYTSTISVEAAAIGKPVMLVGGGWNARRGWTFEPDSPRDYVETLDAICANRFRYKHPLELARRYAYALFIRSNIPIEHYSVLDLVVTALKIESLEDLAPGRSVSMDTICRGILCDEMIEYHPPLAEAGS